MNLKNNFYLIVTIVLLLFYPSSSSADVSGTWQGDGTIFVAELLNDCPNISLTLNVNEIAAEFRHTAMVVTCQNGPFTSTFSSGQDFAYDIDIDGNLFLSTGSEGIAGRIGDHQVQYFTTPGEAVGAWFAILQQSSVNPDEATLVMFLSSYWFSGIIGPPDLGEPAVIRAVLSRS